MQLSHNVLPRGLFRAKREVPERTFFVALQCCLSFKTVSVREIGFHRSPCSSMHNASGHNASGR